MDKLLISALFAFLAGFLTTVISFVKLVNDKEGKVSDFRQQWTISVRESIADLLSKITALCLILEERSGRAINFNSQKGHILNAKSDAEKELLKSLMDYELGMLEKANAQKNELLKEIHAANHLSRLHFKQNDPEFVGIESKIDSILDLLRSAEDRQCIFEKEKLKDMTGRIAVLCSEILSLSRLALKSEWEKVKKGESVYIRTKRVAKWSGVFFFFVFFTLGVHAYIASHKEASLTSSPGLNRQSETLTPEKHSVEIATTCPTPAKETPTAKQSSMNKGTPPNKNMNPT